MRLRYFDLAVAVSFLVVACGATEKDAQSPGCVMAVRMFKPCTFDVNVDSPEQLQSLRQNAIARQAHLSNALTAFCPDSATDAALKTQVACVANVDAVLRHATADATTRRAAAVSAVAALRADARYTAAREKFHALRIQQATACDTGDATACNFAQRDADSAATAMQSLLAEHHIDLRDADALGVW